MKVDFISLKVFEKSFRAWSMFLAKAGKDSENSGRYWTKIMRQSSSDYDKLIASLLDGPTSLSASSAASGIVAQ